MPIQYGFIRNLIHKNTHKIHKVIHRKAVDFIKNSEAPYEKLAGVHLKLGGC